MVDKVTIIDITRPNVPAPKLLHRFCQVDLRIPYEIIYIPVVVSKLKEIVIPKTQNYIIHLNPYTPSTDNLFEFDLSRPKRGKLDERLEYYEITSDFIKSFKSTHKKEKIIIINSCKDGCLTSFEDKVIESNLDLDKEEFLECRFWFQRALVKLSECARGRLIQQTGTCYLTAVINGILITPSIRNLCIQAMKNDLSKDASMKALIMDKDLSELVKLPKNFTGKMFLYKILYHTFCGINKGKATITDMSHNLFKVASGRFFTYYNDEKKKSTFGESGFSIIPLCNLFNEMSLPGLLLFQDKIYNFPSIVPFEDEEDFFALVPSFKPYDKPIDKAAICVQFYDAEQKTINETNIINGKKFNIAFAILGIRAPAKGRGISFSHQILAFFCNGNPMIYDSDSNEFYPVNWLKFNQKEEWDKMRRIYATLNDEILLESFFYDCGVYIQEGKEMLGNEAC